MKIISSSSWRFKISMLFFFLLNTHAFGQSVDPLLQGFKNPPANAYPRTWWHWTKSNISKEGITKDLEWMKRSGIAGFQLADVNAGGGQTVKDPIIFGSPEWLDAVQFAAKEADRLKLEMAIFSSPGWSLTGGSWVKPEEAMKKLVWSEIQVDGAQAFNSQLPAPPANEGAGPNLQNRNKKMEGFYRDVAVIAFHTPTGDDNNVVPRATSSNGQENGNDLVDNDLTTAIVIRPAQKDGKAWIQLNYDQPFPAKAITIAGRRGIPFGKVLASKDGVHFDTLVSLPGKSGYRGGNIRTYSFKETNAKYFRIECTNAPPRPADVISEVVPPPDTVYAISEIHLHAANRINRWEDKSGFNFLFEYTGVSTPAVPSNASIDPSEVIDLTNKMNEDGTLQWNMPSGKWTIMRFGYALTGAKNRPAIAAALGYEVDKMNPRFVEEYMKAYTDPLMKSLGPLYGKRLQYILMDSWEAGIQNWTDIMPAEFKKRRGYDLIRYLPAMTGRVVGNDEISERFLWDFRRTLVDLIAENHYGTITDFLHKQGIKTYGEAGGVSLESIEDALLNKKYVDIPMGEFWVNDLHPSSMYYQDVRGAASSSHAYGKNLVAAESFTGGNYESPQTLKRISDYWFTQGVNRLVFHTSAHQPLDTKPGNTMVGTHIHRNITWAEHVKPFTTYLARNSFMLQRGKYVADLAYLLDEGAPSTMPFWGKGLQPAPPDGYQFDYINADVLVNRMSVNGQRKLTLPDGMKYSILVLPQTSRITLPVLKKIKELVAGGAIVVGGRPEWTPGLTGYPSSDSAVKQLALELWGPPRVAIHASQPYGKGEIYSTYDLEYVLSETGVAKDVAFNYDSNHVSWIHRRDGNTDIYFVVNRTNTTLHLAGRFNIIGKDVEYWHPDNGSIEPASYKMEKGMTTVNISLGSLEAVFVVFKNKDKNYQRVLPQNQYSQLGELTGPWDISFPAGLGAPGKIQIQQLASWIDNADEGVKYFSGTGTYTKSFEINKEWLNPGARVLLDLGEVKDMAEVYVNDTYIDFLWKPPFTTDITNALKAGNNTLRILVTNEWTNRLAGDRDHPDKKILDSYTPPFGRRQYELSPSGLIGPVKLTMTKISLGSH